MERQSIKKRKVNIYMSIISKSETVNVRISKELRNKLKAEAAERGITLQELLEEKLEYK